MKKILVVVDIQNDFVDGALGTAQAQMIIDNAATEIRQFDGDVIVTYDTHFDNYSETMEGKNLPVPHCIKGTYGWQLNQNIQDALDGKNYESIEKITFGSAVDLPSLIKRKINDDSCEIELIGLCTDICVVSNALILKANFPEIEISVNSSCCAGVTPEKHLAALETMRSCQINVY